ncbi:MAG: alanine racemase [Armatimonadota bacterium]
MAKTVLAMQAKNASSWLEIDLARVRHNVGRVRELVGASCQIIAVVKGNGYGHGAVPVSRAAIAAGASRLSVATLVEALELREAGVEAPIVLMGPGGAEVAEEAVANELEVVVSNREAADALARESRRQERTTGVHVKVDSGMGRLGAAMEEAGELVQRVEDAPELRLVGVCSHLATSEEADQSFAREQLGAFDEFCAELRARGLANGAIRHVANSGGILTLPEAHLDAVRPGALVYGLSPGGVAVDDEVRPALTWKARVSHVRQAPKGSSVGYGRRHVLQRDSRVAALAFGYADGYLTALFGKADVLVHGQRAPVVGVVSMDTTMIDVGHIPEARPGDEAVVIGSQGDECITAEELAERAGAVVHEVAARLGARLKRCYLNERVEE